VHSIAGGVGELVPPLEHINGVDFEDDLDLCVCFEGILSGCFEVLQPLMHGGAAWVFEKELVSRFSAEHGDGCGCGAKDGTVWRLGASGGVCDVVCAAFDVDGIGAFESDHGHGDEGRVLEGLPQIELFLSEGVEVAFEDVLEDVV